MRTKCRRRLASSPILSTDRSIGDGVMKHNCAFQGVEGQIVLDQIRTVDKTRLVKKLGQLSPASSDRALAVLCEMFQK